MAGADTDIYVPSLPIVIGACVFAAASVGTALAPPLWAVIALRGVQGVFVAARAVVVDCDDGAERTRATNWRTIAWATGPVLSPALGGYLQAWFGWTASFWFPAGWGAIVVAAAFVVLPEARISERVFKIVGHYGKMASDPVYLPTAPAMACMISVMFGFEALAPLYIQNDLLRIPSSAVSCSLYSGASGLRATSSTA